jgi:hypothetical protein
MNTLVQNAICLPGVEMMHILVRRTHPASGMRLFQHGYCTWRDMLKKNKDRSRCRKTAGFTFGIGLPSWVPVSRNFRRGMDTMAPVRG